jgi:hypothetical protein
VIVRDPEEPPAVYWPDVLFALILLATLAAEGFAIASGRRRPGDGPNPIAFAFPIVGLVLAIGMVRASQSAFRWTAWVAGAIGLLCGAGAVVMMWVGNWFRHEPGNVVRDITVAAALFGSQIACAVYANWRANGGGPALRS